MLEQGEEQGEGPNGLRRGSSIFWGLSIYKHPNGMRIRLVCEKGNDFRFQMLRKLKLW